MRDEVGEARRRLEGDLGVTSLEPCVHAAGDIVEIGVALFAEKGTSAGGAATGFAMNDERDIARNFIEGLGDGAQWNQLATGDGGDDVLFWLADVNEVEFFSALDHFVKFVDIDCRDGVHGDFLLIR